MELKLDPGCVRSFEDRMDELSPWMHSYWFGDDIYTGYYKHEGLDRLYAWVEDLVRMSHPSRGATSR